MHDVDGLVDKESYNIMYSVTVFFRERALIQVINVILFYEFVVDIFHAVKLFSFHDMLYESMFAFSGVEALSKTNMPDLQYVNSDFNLTRGRHKVCLVTALFLFTGPS